MLDKKKQLASKASLKYIENGMTVGLGSGSTVYFLLEELGKLVKEGLQISGVPTSTRTERWAKEFGIPLINLTKDTNIDIAIDGADEVDRHFNLLKGGGGSLVREKIVDALAKELIIIVDDSKMVEQFKESTLPIEVLPFGWEKTSQQIECEGYRPKLRLKDGEPFISDNGNYILDCYAYEINRPIRSHKQLKGMTGVVDTGLFVGMTDRVIVGVEDKVIELEKENKSYRT
ncbi:ribose-5-phosphate isomerase RpiA [Alkalibacillus aidingensis]|uniref:ribose-5-phosphate isomerase RpiA n=1 Tax=Alkalibacillus aidingensis TaxID=2747607 RepID=UPI001660103C|nr:ribose-5-phosphate isomerase RpiA [Alkalibacillus aidingensis]